MLAAFLRKRDLLQGMWEDKKTNKKWVTVTRCFFPDNLPEGVGRPCAPESNEVKFLTKSTIWCYSYSIQIKV